MATLLRSKKLDQLSLMLPETMLDEVLKKFSGNDYHEYFAAVTIIGDIFLFSTEITIWLLQKRDVLECLMQAVKVDNERIVT